MATTTARDAPTTQVAANAAAAPLTGGALVLGTIVLSLATFMNVLDTSIANVSIPEIGEHEVRVEARDARRITRFVAHRPWVRAVYRERGARCTPTPFRCRSPVG